MPRRFSNTTCSFSRRRRSGPDPLDLKQYDICRMADGVLVIVAQDDLLSPMVTRVVVPMLPVAEGGPPVTPLNPVVTFGTQQLKLMPQMVTSVPVSQLGPRVGSVAYISDRIEAAMAALFSGV